jgi:hypothetical protein
MAQAIDISASSAAVDLTRALMLAMGTLAFGATVE